MLKEGRSYGMSWNYLRLHAISRGFWWVISTKLQAWMKEIMEALTYRDDVLDLSLLSRILV